MLTSASPRCPLGIFMLPGSPGGCSFAQPPPAWPTSPLPTGLSQDPLLGSPESGALAQTVLDHHAISVGGHTACLTGAPTDGTHLPARGQLPWPEHHCAGNPARWSELALMQWRAQPWWRKVVLPPESPSHMPTFYRKGTEKR